MKQQKVLYTGMSLSLGLTSGYIYDIEIIKEERIYMVHAIYNHTDDMECDIYCPYSNMKSVCYSWDLPIDIEVK